MSRKETTVKETSASGVNVEFGKTSSVGAGVSIPKDVWENFIIEIASRGITVDIAADGPQITEIKIENKNG